MSLIALFVRMRQPVSQNHTVHKLLFHESLWYAGRSRKSELEAASHLLSHDYYGTRKDPKRGGKNARPPRRPHIIITSEVEGKNHAHKRH